MTTHREALTRIVRICSESSDFSRRIQAVLNESLIALGYTENQRAAHFIKCAQRSEVFKEQRNSRGIVYAKKNLEEAILEDTGEHKKNIKKQALEQYV